MSKAELTAWDITQALKEQHVKDAFFDEVKTGPTWNADRGVLHRIDALAIAKSWTRPNIRAYEIKVSRSDFLHDDKWPAYREYCHRLYFACPAGLIKPEELADDVGLVYVNPESRAVTTRKAARFRDIEIPVAMFYYLILSKIDKDHDDSASREYRLQDAKAWLEGKRENRILGFAVASRMARTVEEQAKQLRDNEWAVKTHERDRALLDAITKVLYSAGIYGGEPEKVAADLRLALSGVDQNFQYTLRNVREHLTKAASLLGEAEESVTARKAVGQ